MSLHRSLTLVKEMKDIQSRVLQILSSQSHTIQRMQESLVVFDSFLTRAKTIFKGMLKFPCTNNTTNKETVSKTLAIESRANLTCYRPKSTETIKQPIIQPITEPEEDAILSAISDGLSHLKCTALAMNIELNRQNEQLQQLAVEVPRLSVSTNETTCSMLDI
jgi:hypothetical protein